jgi:8-oxo-dGTP pyrophosphatase MutT (NUDIX family)
LPDRRVCPVLVRQRRVLAFRHPLAGCQLVKGRYQAGEGAVAAARRELWEESGLRVMGRPRRQWRAPVGGQMWDFVAFDAGRSPWRWSHWAEDDGGHLFRFFWHPLSQKAGVGWHPMFHQALRRISGRYVGRVLSGSYP